jgi:anti-sigma factor RsiW
MNVTREVILDLLPVYVSGEASPATCALVEEYLKQDAELAQRIRLLLADNFAKAMPPALPPELVY